MLKSQGNLKLINFAVVNSFLSWQINLFEVGENWWFDQVIKGQGNRH